ncbi:DUF3039 domain-containing protein [Kribbella solani]|uniref:DUF3039 domain-containing protein n=1 Tax=Kribbella solani TaxID=236067 RepID=UPI0029ACB0B1|nr:DUF3039 domain-containing protein [Kribbella solani]MDX2970867.1 DUF3039 domain-containing protein [Kribbella solani]MDX3003712.1 DUF3039 domain-containing protein [Kribbella solani]
MPVDSGHHPAYGHHWLVHSRRARPTLRVLVEDLTSNWASPHAPRELAKGEYDNLHPLSELPHPIIAKAAESFGSDASNDNYVGQIASSTALRLLEIKNSQWRGGVWEEPETGVCWLLVAGLAKGGHEDRDDFYRRIQRENTAGTSRRWLPTEDDRRLLRRETAARLLTEWELGVQRQVFEALRAVEAGGNHRSAITHPVRTRGTLAELDLSVVAVREDGYEADEIVLEVIPAPGCVGTELLWQLSVRALITLNPPEQGWDRFKDTYSNIAEPGFWTARADQLAELIELNELAVSQPGTTSHYAHREHLAGRTIDGRAVRGLCGVYFVPRQDHAALEPCTVCAARYSKLPG